MYVKICFYSSNIGVYAHESSITLLYCTLGFVVRKRQYYAGCEYHPYYDGQKFCVYFSRNGLIETDGEHIYVPVISRDPYMIECYGGLGENYSLDIADTQILECSFTEKAIGVFRYDEPQPAAFVIEPKQIGDT